MALCKGPSVPEEIIEYLFEQSKDTHSYQNFSSARRVLEGRQLIRISVFKDMYKMGKEGKRWTLHDMIKEFIMKEYLLPKDSKASWIQRLCSNSIMFKFDSALEPLEFQVVSTLIASYFNERFQVEFEQVSSLKMDNPDVTWRVEVIEPISRLLVLRENDQWTSILHLSTRQVFLTFVRDGQFNEESILNLLDSDQSAPRVIVALSDFASRWACSMLGEKVICALLRLLEKATALDASKEQRLDYDLLSGICLAVRRVVGFGKTGHRSSGTFLEGVSLSTAFAQLGNLLMNATHDDHSRTQQQVVGAIAVLAQSYRNIRLELANTPGILEGLVKASFEVDNHGLQATAVNTLATFSRLNDSLLLQMTDDPGMLDGLVKASAVNDHQLQWAASGLLRQLSRNDHTALKIVECPGALDELMNGLSKVTNSFHQDYCAQALGHLASRFDNVKMRLSQFTEGLVNDFFSNHDHDLQATAVNALATLAQQSDSFRLQIVDVPGLLDRLVKALTANDHHRLQSEASRLFGSLSSFNDHAALKIVECPGALDELVNGLSKSTNKLHQKRCVKVLGNLASRGGNVKFRLLQFPYILEGLVKVAFRDDNYDLESAAVEVLGSLARENAHVKLQLVDVPGMLDGLVKALTVNDHHQLEWEASGLLSSLSLNDHAALKIVECPGALDEIMNGLRKDTNVVHQENCAKVLGHLASRVDNVKVRALQFIEGLVKESFNDDNRDLQATTVNVLATLAQENDSFRLHMVDVSGLLDRLVKALAANDQHRLQCEASRLFGWLTLNDYAALKIAECPGALDELVNGLGKDTNVLHQKHCAEALGYLASISDGMRLRLIQFPKLTQELVGALLHDCEESSTLRLASGLALARLADGNHSIKSKMRNLLGFQEALIDAVRKDDNNGWAIYVLTALSPQRGKEIHLSSTDAYSRRGEAETHLGLYKEALEDLDEACRLGGSNYKTFRTRCYVKARLSDFQKAFVDVNTAVEKSSNSWTLLDRGVLKRMLGDLPGALEDLDKRLDLLYFDVPRGKYTRLKHRGFIKFLLGDEFGARADAESAMACKPLAVDESGYGTWSVGEGWSAEYLNFQLR